VRPGAVAGVAVEKHQQPGADIITEPGGEFTGPQVDPGADRQGGVVEQQVKVGQYLRDPKVGGVP
jgi:hypothetical protein